MRNILRMLFLVIGTITIMEYLFVRGMFTWFIVVTASIVAGAANAIWDMKEKKYLNSLLYIMATVALVMGYFKLL